AAGGCEISGPNTGSSVTVLYRAWHASSASVTCSVTIEPTNEFGTGTGELRLVVRRNENIIAKRGVRLALQNIDWFYDYYSVEKRNGTVNNVEISQDYFTMREGAYSPPGRDMLLFVHGWNMEEWEKMRWAETVFKRLWWLGYQGRMALFSWPTLYGIDGRFSTLMDLMNFDNSEFIAWKSAEALASLLETLSARYSLTALAHSMGNVVMGEALRKREISPPPRYIATQAAVSAQFYNSNCKVLYPASNVAFSLGYLGGDVTGDIVTPDVYGHFHSGTSATAPYHAATLGRASSALNLFNPEDYALRLWDQNNITKPDFHWTNRFCYSGQIDSYEEPRDRCYQNLSLVPGNREYYYLGSNAERDRFTIFSYIMQSHSRPLGTVALPHTVGTLDNVNLASLRDSGGAVIFDNSHYGHSRQFRSFLAEVRAYWSLLQPTAASRSRHSIRSGMFQ
ncbi:MAG: alpha/beta hydrolase, partial [Victivallales bacterium]|nr:alpha/beta hydrolase [Victivallales bacterium]